ncbi:MAG TPA: lipid-A-disaccharide synthase [Chthoniobacteraceae bacterium]|jgi:lipid-A-disaccharide synthase|nr:lipid-A-disaccharide synthase [Chthoniobacteraceae bacterium]
MNLYLVAGEASGDARGAELIRSLRARRSDIEFHGFGGPQMAALAGPEMVRDWIERAGVIGIIDVLKNYGYFRQNFKRALAEIARMKPDAVVLIDYPGFNLRLAKALRRAGTAAKVIDYISPQVWAWNRRRIPEMARSLDLMVCIFPFEKPLYEQSGLKTVFAGHPMLDSLAEKRIGAPREENLLGLLPGSREREVRKIFPVMLDAAAILAKTRPALRVEAAAASGEMRRIMEEIARRYPGVRCDITLKTAHSLMQRATAGMVASGTATLEAAYFGLPFVLLYKAAWLTFAIGRRLVRVKWLGMPNILANREVVREFLQEAALPGPIAAEVAPLLDDPGARTLFQETLRGAISTLGEPGASTRAADAILDILHAG